MSMGENHTLLTNNFFYDFLKIRTSFGQKRYVGRIRVKTIRAKLGKKRPESFCQGCRKDNMIGSTKT